MGFSHNIIPIILKGGTFRRPDHHSNCVRERTRHERDPLTKRLLCFLFLATTSSSLPPLKPHNASENFSKCGRWVRRGEEGRGAMTDKAGWMGEGGMFLSTRTINQQHNHFLGIPCASRERGSGTERPSVCWERRRRAGNQKNTLFTVCVTRPLSSQGPQASHRLSSLCWIPLQMCC